MGNKLIVNIKEYFKKREFCSGRNCKRKKNQSSGKTVTGC